MLRDNRFRLVTLGRLTLVGTGGEEDASLARRRLKLAVLAVLALARRPISRDTLLGLFWAEHDEPRARHSLSNALSSLRGALGERSITTRDAEVALDPETPLDVARQGSGVDYMSGSFGLVHAEIGVRAALSKSNPDMVPYLLAAIGRRAVGARVTDFEDGEIYDMSLSGNMLTFGGGLEYKLSRKVSLDGGIEFGIGTFSHVDDGDVYTISVNNSTSTRLRAGVVWRP